MASDSEPPTKEARRLRALEYKKLFVPKGARIHILTGMSTFRAIQIDPQGHNVTDVQFPTKLFVFFDAASKALGTRKIEVTSTPNFLAVLYTKDDYPEYKLYNQTISGPAIIYNMKLDMDTCANVKYSLEEIEQNIQWPTACLAT